VEGGLVDGSKLFTDASLIEADACNKSVLDLEKLQKDLDRGYQRLEERLEDLTEQKTVPVSSRYVSTTDPDASLIRHGGGEPKLRYKTHRAVDAQQEVITATLVSPGATDESALLKEVIKCHEQNTKEKVETVVADSRYGTIENYLFCHDSGIQAPIRSLEETQRGSGRREDIFSQRKLSITIRKRIRLSAPVAGNCGGVIFTRSVTITNTRPIPESVLAAG
jgi:hypothetical protein